MRLPGGIVLVILVGLLLSRWKRISYLWMADTIAPAAGLVIFGIRIGCLLEGCCHGTLTSLPWAIRFADHSLPFVWHAAHGSLPVGALTTPPLHPLQIYFALVGVVLFAALAAYAPRKRYDGEILLMFALGYFWSTWLLEFLRAQSHAPTQQFVLLAAVASTILFAMFEAGRGRRARHERLAGAIKA
jgi:phosphatidylglycerol:prolipoprotein diacylglycerol transferase